MTNGNAREDERTRIEAMEHDPVPPLPVRERLIWLSIAIGVPPVFWALQLLLLSAFTTYACFPAFAPLLQPTVGWVSAWVWVVDLIAILAAAGAGLTSLHYFRPTRDRIAIHSDAISLWPLDRLCFMSLGGLLSSAGFLAAILFETLASFMATPCAG